MTPPLYQDPVPDNSKDPYYEAESIKAIEQACKAAQGKPAEEIRSAIRRSYPFGPLRTGRPYKVWNRLVLEKEQELGLPPRKHKQTQLRAEELARQVHDESGSN